MKDNFTLEDLWIWPTMSNCPVGMTLTLQPKNITLISYPQKLWRHEAWILAYRNLRVHADVWLLILFPHYLSQIFNQLCRGLRLKNSKEYIASYYNFNLVKQYLDCNNILDMTLYNLTRNLPCHWSVLLCWIHQLKLSWMVLVSWGRQRV